MKTRQIRWSNGVPRTWVITQCGEGYEDCEHKWQQSNGNYHCHDYHCVYCNATAQK